MFHTAASTAQRLNHSCALEQHFLHLSVTLQCKVSGARITDVPNRNIAPGQLAPFRDIYGRAFDVESTDIGSNLTQPSNVIVHNNHEFAWDN